MRKVDIFRTNSSIAHSHIMLGRTKPNEPLLDGMKSSQLAVSTFIKGHTATDKEKCGDALIVSSRPGFLFAAVFDEIGKKGETSHYVASIMARFIERNYTEFGDRPELLLKTAAYYAESIIKKEGKSPLTAVAMLMDMGFRYTMLHVGDGDAFARYENGDVRNLIEARIEKGTVPRPLRDDLQARRPVWTPLGTENCVHADSANIATGELLQNETLLITTDGPTKQMLFEVDVASKEAKVVSPAPEIDIKLMLSKKPSDAEIAHYLGELLGKKQSELLGKKPLFDEHESRLGVPLYVSFHKSAESGKTYVRCHYPDDMAMVAIAHTE